VGSVGVRSARAKKALVNPYERTESVPVESADGSVLASSTVADRGVPHYTCAAMDGYGVRAEEPFDAETRSLVALRVGSEAAGVGEGEAARVHTGSEVPEGESVEVQDRVA